MIAAEMTSGSKIILVVEDDSNILLAVSALLETEGYMVIGAKNGSAALDLLNNQGMPHLILLDMIMPVMNGWEFASEFVKKYDHLSPIIVMTAANDAKQRARDIGATGWIGKPFDMDKLLGIIRKYERA